MSKKLFVILNIFLLILFFPLSCLANYSNYIWSSNKDITALTSSNISKEYIDDSSNPLKLDCESAILIEQTTGKVLYSSNSHEKLRPASVTKVMSILLIMDAIKSGKINYDTQIPCSENAASMGGSQIWLDTTETLSVNDMLKAICVVSANDCVVAMAEYIGGTEEGFVKMMNDKAKSLGMNDTTFKNCHGIDEDGHETSSYDISIMSKELLNNYPQITKYTTIWNDSLRNGKSELVNTNKLVHNYKGCTGLKTGSTSQALFNLSASATRDNLSLIAVVMKAPTSKLRFSCTSSLLDYGFSNFSFSKLADKGNFVQTISVSKGTTSYTNAVFEDDCGALIAKGHDSNIDKIISINNDISAPVFKGDVIGSVSFKLDGEIIDTVNLVSDNNIPKFNIFSMNKKVFSNWFYLLRK